jgi:hypothetical protein
MFIDSCLADQIHTVATSLNVPVLSVHYSFIVAREDQETLTHIIRAATREQLGHALWSGPIVLLEAVRPA